MSSLPVPVKSTAADTPDIDELIQKTGARRHPLVKPFPFTSKTQHHALAANIRKQGQLRPVIMLEGLIIDGWDREVARQLAGASGFYKHFNDLPRKTTPLAYVKAEILYRLHLDPDQLAVIEAALDKIENDERRQHIDPAATASSSNDTTSCETSEQKREEHPKGVPPESDVSITMPQAKPTESVPQLEYVKNDGERVRRPRRKKVYELDIE